MAESTNNSEDDRLSCKILIIGAGMAGLSAATHLLKNSETDFLIVEARGRIGGRIIATQVGTISVITSPYRDKVFNSLLNLFTLWYNSDRPYNYSNDILRNLQKSPFTFITFEYVRVQIPVNYVMIEDGVESVISENIYISFSEQMYLDRFYVMDVDRNLQFYV